MVLSGTSLAGKPALPAPVLTPTSRPVPPVVICSSVLAEAFKLSLGRGEASEAKGPFNEAAQDQVKSPSTVTKFMTCNHVVFQSDAPPCPPLSWHPLSFPTV